MSPLSGTLLTGQLLVRVKNDLEPEARDVAAYVWSISHAWLPSRSRKPS
jgi:hypothetical protein